MTPPKFRRSTLDRVADSIAETIIVNTGDGVFADYVVEWLRENVEVVDG